VRLFKLLLVLGKLGRLHPAALFRLLAAIRMFGVNLLALLHVSAETFGDRIALTDERETRTYRQLFERSKALADELRDKWGLAAGQKAGLLCRNHVPCVEAVFAVSATGADLLLLNPDMGADQLDGILGQHDPDLLIADEEFGSKLSQTSFSKRVLWSGQASEPARIRAGSGGRPTRRRASSGRLALLTGGTTGRARTAVHRPSLFRYLDVFDDFVSRLNILACERAYVATPLCHGYGLAVLLLFLAIGRQVALQRGFDAEKACRLIRERRIDVVTVVPLMLHRMLKTGAADLRSLRCIASGGAELGPKLASETRRLVGDVLYNLYGTSETGLNMIATPRDLARRPGTVGKPVKGVRVKIVDADGRELGVGQVGQLVVRSRGAAGHRAGWMATGDLGCRDEEGYYFLRGRTDSMIVSGGENVYPRDVELVLLAHPKVADAAVIGVADDEFGQRLKAFAVPETGETATPEELMEWLRPRLARYQMPREIAIVDRLPYTPLGKLDRKRLR